MNKIDKKFQELKKAGKKALIVYITCGYPDLSATPALIMELQKNGTDIIELGIPFSDPVADGPTIQDATYKALNAGTTVKGVFRMLSKIKDDIKVPLVFMTYYNIVLRYGFGRFIKDSKACGVEGLIIPDMPAEESKELSKAARGLDFSNILLASPTSSPNRLRKIADMSKGFIYYVSLKGVTGARSSLPKDVALKVKSIKRMTGKPVCVGFGVSDKTQALKISKMADGVIVGSAVLKELASGRGNKDGIAKAGRFVKKLADAVHGGR